MHARLPGLRSPADAACQLKRGYADQHACYSPRCRVAREVEAGRVKKRELHGGMERTEKAQGKGTAGVASRKEE